MKQALLVLFGAVLTLGVQFLTDRLREGRQERLERGRRRAVEREAALREIAQAVSYPLEVLENAASDYRPLAADRHYWWSKVSAAYKDFDWRWQRDWRFLFTHDETTERHVRNMKVLMGSFASRIDGDSIGREDVQGFAMELRSFHEHCLRQASLD